MIQPRGKRTEAHGERVQRTIAVINELYPTPTRPVSLWYIEDQQVRVTETGSDYGCIIKNQDAPTMFVAAHHEPERIAGIIAMQYAYWLQYALGISEDQQEAVAFAKYVTGRSPQRPSELLDTYAENYPEAPGVYRQEEFIKLTQEAEEVNHD